MDRRKKFKKIGVRTERGFALLSQHNKKKRPRGMNRKQDRRGQMRKKEDKDGANTS